MYNMMNNNTMKLNELMPYRFYYCCLIGNRLLQSVWIFLLNWSFSYYQDHSRIWVTHNNHNNHNNQWIYLSCVQVKISLILFLWFQMSKDGAAPPAYGFVVRIVIIKIIITSFQLLLCIRLTFNWCIIFTSHRHQLHRAMRKR